MEDNVILVDCDGVLLDWTHHFDRWMNDHGYRLADDAGDRYSIMERYNLTLAEKNRVVRTFNESATIGYLPPFRDAVRYIRRLHEEHGFVFHVISSLSNDVYAHRLRAANLERVFGETVFDRFVFLDTGADKDFALDDYAGSNLFWIEDKHENAMVGHDLGLRSILIEHGHNRNEDCPFPRLANWKEIYHHIVG